MRPLYKTLAADRELVLACRRAGNRGLWYDKLFDQWEAGKWEVRQPDRDDPGGKRDWIDFARSDLVFDTQKRREQAKPDRCGHAELLKETKERIEVYVRASNGVIVEAVTAERFVTGTGLPHPIENGFLWHHTLGVPYLPGSGVKGIVLSWDRDWANEARDEDRQTMLGKGPVRVPGAAADPGHAGRVAFLDALPPGPVMLDLDGVTPHDTPYLQDRDGKTPPADWHNPVPIPFLAVAKGERFRFPIVPRSGQDPALVNDAAEWLCSALKSLGAGAKTAVDHGRFKDCRIL